MPKMGMAIREVGCLVGFLMGLKFLDNNSSLFWCISNNLISLSILLWWIHWWEFTLASYGCELIGGRTSWATIINCLLGSSIVNVVYVV